MSTVFPKNKKKRSRSPPSEANSSFVKNVTSRVSGLLPATITKWFSSPSSSNANGSAPTADATDSSTEDEAPESPIIIQPPLKRMRFSSPGKFNNYPPIEANSTPTANIETLDSCNSYDSLPSLPGRTTFRRETNFVSTPLRSSVEESQVEKNDKEINTFKPSHTMTSVEAPVPLKRKSLFDSFSNGTSTRSCVKTANNTMVDPNQPCFKPSLLGSPFYSGRTMYGGASASYVNQPNIKQRRNLLVNQTNSNENNTISHSARRIMDLLEDYSSPLNEAKRIPQYVRPAQKKSPKGNDNSVLNENKTISYKTQELHVPSIASILRLKRRSRLMDTTTAARQIIASHSSTSNYPLYTPLNVHRESTENETNSTLITKVKTKLTRTKRGNANLETDLPVAVNLPAASLQIDESNLPKFSFGIPISTNIATNSKPSSNFTEMETKTHNSATTNKTETTTQSKKPELAITNTYKFSSPFKITLETPPKFTFGSPERSIDVTNKDKNVTEITKPSENVVKDSNLNLNSVTSKSTDWQCDNCWVFNKADTEKCICCESPKLVKAKAEVKTIKCTSCKVFDAQASNDKCVNCDLIKADNIIKPAVTNATQTNKWSCEDCWVKNDDNTEKCVCCGCKRPNNSAFAKETAIPKHSPEIEWKCEDCWIKNKISVDKCIACGGSRKDVKQSVTVTSALNTKDSKAPGNSLKDIIKNQTNKWECSNCLVRNDNDRVKCVCCETERPGVTHEADKKTFNFGVNTTFKFGIDPKLHEANKLTEPKQSSETTSKTKESETNNNTISHTPTFTFSLPTKKLDDQTNLDKKSESKINNVSKISFSFGIPKSVTTLANSETTTTTNTSITAHSAFATENKSDPQKMKPEEKEKPQEVPKVDLLAVPNTQESPKLTNLFSPTFTTQAGQGTSTSSALSLQTEKKDVPSNPSTLIPPVSEIAATPSKTPSFSFSVQSKPNTNIFGSTTTAGISFMASVQNTPVTTTAPIFEKAETAATLPTISMFQKNDNTGLSTSLFQKTDTSTTVLPASTLGATAPIFSFGTNTQPAPQTEKPKFNFTFGSNKTETPSLFKNTFGSTDDSSGAKFLGPANSVPGSAALGSGNILTSGVTMTNDILGSSSGHAANNLGNRESLLPNNTVSSGNILQGGNGPQNPAGGIFGAPVQKENIWSASNNTSNNLFASNVSTNNLQKPMFTFGSSTTFNAPSATPAFGNTAQTAPNVFGMANQSTNNQTAGVFSNSGPNQTVPNIFGSPQQTANNAPPALGMFGTPNVGAAPSFGAPNASIPSFEAPSLTPAPAPTFNFGAPQTSGVFGFGQQAQPQQTPSMYAFGSGSVAATGAGGGGGAAPLQFNMGSAPSPAVRRVRKAVRRTTLR